MAEAPSGSQVYDDDDDDDVVVVRSISHALSRPNHHPSHIIALTTAITRLEQSTGPTAISQCHYHHSFLTTLGMIVIMASVLCFMHALTIQWYHWSIIVSSTCI